jgi:hypothetical protein
MMEIETRVARFVSVQRTKKWKMYQIAIKYVYSNNFRSKAYLKYLNLDFW